MSERAHRAGVDAGSGSGADGQSPLEALEGARRRFEEADRQIADAGGDAVAEAAEAYRDATTLLEDYVDRATGTGRENFKAYVELEGQFDSLVSGLPDDLKGREAFEEALDAIDKRRLSESDFERAHEALEPAARYAELLDEREAAREAIAEARTAAAKRRRELGDEISERERLVELGEADLEAPVEELREPIEAYNEAIETAFEEYRLEASAREVFELLERSRWYPFVDYERPPTTSRPTSARIRPASTRSPNSWSTRTTRGRNSSTTSRARTNSSAGWRPSRRSSTGSTPSR